MEECCIGNYFCLMASSVPLAGCKIMVHSYAAQSQEYLREKESFLWAVPRDDPAFLKSDPWFEPVRRNSLSLSICWALTVCHGNYLPSDRHNSNNIFS